MSDTTAGATDAPDLEIDARGLACPLPVIELAKAARDAQPGDVITVWCTDPAARIDIPAWARMTGNHLVPAQYGPQSETDGLAFAMTVRLAEEVVS